MLAKKIAVVEFESGYKSYEFKTDIEDLHVGDYVVVDTSSGINVARVVEIKDYSNKATKWVIQKLDMTKHQERLEKEKKLKEIQAKMEARRKQLQELEIYRLLAKEDAEMAKLLEEYTSLV